MSDMEEYRAKVEALDDPAFVKEVAHRVWLSAYAANNPRSAYHAQCDATYDEAARRGKPWLYQKGWNEAFRSSGHEPSDEDIARARPSHPSYAQGTSASGQTEGANND